MRSALTCTTADGWEPAGDGEAVRILTASAVQSNLATGLPEETSGLAFGPGGAFGSDLYVAFANSRGSTPAVRRVTSGGAVSDFAVSPQFVQTNQLAFDTTGNFNSNLFVSDWGAETIWEIDSAGTASVFASGFTFSDIASSFHDNDGGDLVFGPDGALYVADGSNGDGVVWRISLIPEPSSCLLLMAGATLLAQRRRT